MPSPHREHSVARLDGHSWMTRQTIGETAGILIYSMLRPVPGWCPIVFRARRGSGVPLFRRNLVCLVTESAVHTKGSRRTDLVHWLVSGCLWTSKNNPSLAPLAPWTNHKLSKLLGKATNLRVAHKVRGRRVTRCWLCLFCHPFSWECLSL